jgi:hypothetical protein
MKHLVLGLLVGTGIDQQPQTRSVAHISGKYQRSEPALRVESIHHLANTHKQYRHRTLNTRAFQNKIESEIREI